MNIATIGLTKGGKILAQNLSKQLNATYITKKGQKVAELLAENWKEYDAFVCVMATGITVRAIAPLIEDKALDPCVLILDEKGNNVISLLSGHLGGGNHLTLKIAELLNANPVITTASDVLELAALDLWAKENKLTPPKRPMLTALSAKMVNVGQLQFYTDLQVESLPAGLTQVSDPEEADFIISHSTTVTKNKSIFIPHSVVIGTGCNRGTPAAEFEQALTELCSELGIARASIRNLASIDAKNDETGLLQFAADNGWEIDFFNKETINTLQHLAVSTAAMKAVGAIGVAEPACLLSAKSDILLSRKKKWKNVTMAAALVPCTLSAQAPAAKTT